MKPFPAERRRGTILLSFRKVEVRLRLIAPVSSRPAVTVAALLVARMLTERDMTFWTEPRPT
jgi:hypothetical protein